MTQDASRNKVGRIATPVQAGQALLYQDDGTVVRTAGRPNCIALDTIDFAAGDVDKPIRILLLQAAPANNQEKVCGCGHPAGMHRSSDDHCNAPGCNCTFPSCGH